LPRYVTDSPDSMPAIRLYEGELNGFFMMVRKLADRVDAYSSLLSDVSRELQLLKARCIDLLTGSGCDQQGRSANSQPSTEWPTATSSKTTEQPPAVVSNVPEWANIASTPYVHQNRFDMLRSADDDDSHSDAPWHMESFTAVQSRRGRRRVRQ